MTGAEAIEIVKRTIINEQFTLDQIKADDFNPYRMDLMGRQHIRLEMLTDLLRQLEIQESDSPTLTAKADAILRGLDEEETHAVSTDEAGFEAELTQDFTFRIQAADSTELLDALVKEVNMEGLLGFRSRVTLHTQISARRRQLGDQ